LLVLFALFYRLRITWLFFVAFYIMNLLVAPGVVWLGETFFTRFIAYRIFADAPTAVQLIGVGFNRYHTLQGESYGPFAYMPPPVMPGFVASRTDEITANLYSMWGGLLIEGGLVFVGVFCAYVVRVVARARDATGYALIAVLLMLANFYSPWWPIVAFALAYALHSAAPYDRHETRVPDARPGNS
jgi:hypothetical protein